MPAAVAPSRGKAVTGGLQSSRAPKAKPAGSGSTTSTVARSSAAVRSAAHASMALYGLVTTSSSSLGNTDTANR